jgi:hypothetical protein
MCLGIGDEYLLKEEAVWGRTQGVAPLTFASSWILTLPSTTILELKSTAVDVRTDAMAGIPVEDSCYQLM